MSPQQYSSVAKSFHWIIAALVLVDFALGVSFSQFNPGDTLYLPFAYGMHMSIGMTLLAVSVACVLWRLTHHYPRSTAGMTVTWRLAAKTVQFLLYIFIIVVPFTGWAVLSVRKKPAVLLGSMHWPNAWFLADLPRPLRGYYHDMFLPAHVVLSYIGIGLVCLHAVAALSHHFLRRDDVLRRMLPGRRVHATTANDAQMQRTDVGVR